MSKMSVPLPTLSIGSLCNNNSFCKMFSYFFLSEPRLVKLMRNEMRISSQSWDFIMTFQSIDDCFLIRHLFPSYWVSLAPIARRQSHVSCNVHDLTLEKSQSPIEPSQSCGRGSYCVGWWLARGSNTVEITVDRTMVSSVHTLSLRSETNERVWETTLVSVYSLLDSSLVLY